jgi:alkylhydroperoxidase family enzyme
VARDWRSAPLEPEDRALCTFAADLTNRQSTMAAGDLDRLRAHGFDDRAIHDEDFIQPWGRVE